MDIEIDIAPDGPLARESEPLRWVERPIASGCQEAIIAGQPITLRQVSRNPQRFELEYLGLVGRGFQSQDQAQATALDFVQHVFGYLSEITANMPNTISDEAG